MVFFYFSLRLFRSLFRRLFDYILVMPTFRVWTEEEKKRSSETFYFAPTLPPPPSTHHNSPYQRHISGRGYQAYFVGLILFFSAGPGVFLFFFLYFHNSSGPVERIIRSPLIVYIPIFKIHVGIFLYYGFTPRWAAFVAKSRYDTIRTSGTLNSYFPFDDKPFENRFFALTYSWDLYTKHGFRCLLTGFTIES